MHRVNLLRYWLRPIAAVAGLIGAIAGAVAGNWFAFAIYLAVFLAFGALTLTVPRDLRAARTDPAER